MTRYCPEGWERLTKSEFARGCPKCRERRAAKARMYRAGLGNLRDEEGESLSMSRLGDYFIRRGEDGTLDIRHRLTGEVAQWA